MSKPLLCIALVSLIAACGTEETKQTETADGMLVYGTPRADGNTFACATCHALSEPASDGLRRAGHPIGDATRRPSWKNGRVSDVRSAVNSCLREWMNAPELAADDPEWVGLHAFLESRATEDVAPALSFEILPAPPEEGLGGGDADAGHALFNKSCAVCHGKDAVGTEKAPQLAGTKLPASYIGLRVRTSGLTDSPVYDGLSGGKMPFWSADRLSEDELKNLVAWIAGSDLPEEPMVEEMPDDEPDPEQPGCAATHPKVGMTATLSTFAHGVSGTATIVDDCTIELTDFNFDGNGIDIRVYGAAAGDYKSGFAISDNLKNFPTGYEGATMRLNIGEHSLDGIDGVSIWCVPVGVSFGDGLFK